MISQDYTKEIAVASPQHVVPWRYAFIVLAALAVGAWFGVKALMNHSTLDHATHESAPAAPAPTPPPATTPAPAPKP
jgi:hypothetical protein